MKQKLLSTIFVFFLLFLLALCTAQVAMATDARAQKIATYLAQKHSPLTYFADDFVAEADRNGFDYSLLVAISGVESTFGQNYLTGTFNAYGWGGGEITFKSWPDGIAQVSLGLKKGYLDKGTKDIDQIARIYCPPSSAHWAARVRYFMAAIDVVDTTNYAPPAIPTSNQLPLTL